MLQGGWLELGHDLGLSWGDLREFFVWGVCDGVVRVLVGQERMVGAVGL